MPQARDIRSSPTRLRCHPGAHGTAAPRARASCAGRRLPGGSAGRSVRVLAYLAWLCRSGTCGPRDLLPAPWRFGRRSRTAAGGALVRKLPGRARGYLRVLFEKVPAVLQMLADILGAFAELVGNLPGGPLVHD